MVKKSKRLKRLYKQLQFYSPIIGIISIVLGVSFFTINYFKTQHAHRLAESWRNALSRSLEDIQKGGEAHPIRTPEKWAVNFKREPTATAVLAASVTAVVIRHNSTLQPEHANVTCAK